MRVVNGMLDEIKRLMRDVKGVCDEIAHDLRAPLTRLLAGSSAPRGHGSRRTIEQASTT
ncbi:hypothetical protein [Paraburkholderia rhynchosiae]|uniref:hypothetical protein n=1 Tax=Paraburkholderia rhynchosiae TaxID=487049 RepID=UPI001FCA21A5|nr:hypothetical protein [Paraburkholderia rhynchosiae]